jgi:hypothetical protein
LKFVFFPLISKEYGVFRRPFDFGWGCIEGGAP